MELDCRGCAGCCLDWRPLAADGDSPESVVAERRGPYPPLSGAYNLVPLDRDEVRGFVEAGLADALTPRLWLADEDPSVEIDGHRLAAVGDRPAFFVGLRKPPKPVAPFDRETASWLPTCVFLDPDTLQCRIYDDERYPSECAEYPAHTLALETETECERVEAAVGGERLLSREVDDEAGTAPLFGPQAIGGKLFCHPRPAALAGAVDRLARGDATVADRAEFVAVAAASSPGTTAISEPHYEEARDRVLATSSWAGEAIADWDRLAAAEAEPTPRLAERVEEERGAPATPGWGDRQ